MTALALIRAPAGFDPFTAGTGLAVITGALAIVVPYLALATGTLAALAFAAWAIGRERRAGRAGRFGTARWALVGLAVAGLLYLDPPHDYAPYRSLVLALGLVGLWAAERRRAATVRPGEA